MFSTFELELYNVAILTRLSWEDPTALSRCFLILMGNISHANVRTAIRFCFRHLKQKVLFLGAPTLSIVA